jgi:hypothetical protein
MRVQEISRGGTIQNEDMLFGSQFIEKGKYRNLNFNIKEIIGHITAGLPKNEGTFSIQVAEQDSNCNLKTPADLINRNPDNINVPNYGLLFIKMLKNESGACEDLFLFTRTGDTFGESANQCSDKDFLKLGSDNFGSQINIENQDLVLDNRHDKATIFIDSGCTIVFNDKLKDNFKVRLINISDSHFSMVENETEIISNVGTVISGKGASVQAIKRNQDKKIYITS